MEVTSNTNKHMDTNDTNTPPTMDLDDFFNELLPALLDRRHESGWPNRLISLTTANSPLLVHIAYEFGGGSGIIRHMTYSRKAGEFRDGFILKDWA